MKSLKYPFTYEDFIKHPRTIKAMKIIMNDIFPTQLSLDFNEVKTPSQQSHK